MSHEPFAERIIALSPALVVGIQPDGTTTFVNPAAERVTGYAAAELIGRNWWQVFYPGKEYEQVEALFAAFALGDVRDYEMDLTTKQGDKRTISWSSFNRLDDDGRIVEVIGFGNDFTDRLRAEQALRENERRTREILEVADRMVSLGTLAAGIAHELNNPLSYVLTNIELLSERLSSSDDPALREMVQEAETGVTRMRNIVGDLKTFSRADDERCKIVVVRRSLDLALAMTRKEVSRRARVIVDYAEIEPVLADEVRLGQVFTNVLLNAAQAISDDDAERNEIRVRMLSEGLWSVVEISDTGDGIPENVYSRIFEPFFTTKPIGVGTGLGLSICHGIIAGLGGEITARANADGRGTTVRIAIPTANAPMRRPTAENERKRILVVDDDPDIAICIARALRHHEVVIASNGQEGLDRIRCSDQPFDIVFCDLMMPEMTGMEFHREIQAAHPDLAERLIFITGGACTQQARDFIDQRASQCVSKPFDLTTIRHLVGW